ncbi:MAG TPA: cupin domain-containing protein [Chitinophagaceae bacterium]|nr:cupin domain-containing protein [Chitinophagaceae bacterium]
MSDKIIYRNNKQSLINKNVDVATGSDFFCMEGKKVQLTWFVVPPNTNFSNHKHESEQITYILEGELFFKSEDTVYKLSKGDCILVPGNIDHEVWTEKSFAKAIDAWSPVNKLYSNKNSLNK